MAKVKGYLADGKTRVDWVPAGLSGFNMDSPSVAKLTDPTVLALHDAMTPGGLKMSNSNVEVDSGVFSQKSDTKFIGRKQFSNCSLEFYFENDRDVDDIRNTLTFQAEGYLVIRRDLDVATAYAAGQMVEVWPIQIGERDMNNEQNRLAGATINFAVTRDPHEDDDPAVLVA